MNVGNTSATLPQSYPDDEVRDDAASLPRPSGWVRAGRIWRMALDVVLPPLCLGCQSPLADHDALCSQCWRRIDFIQPPLCDRLGLPMPYDIGGPMISAAAAAHPPVYERARAVARYDGLMRQMIHDFKFRDSHDGRRLFGRWLCQAGRELLREADCIVPIPLARMRLLSRRYNQAQILAAEVSLRSGTPLLPQALIRVRPTARQIGLTRRERERNVAGAFAINARSSSAISGKSVLLIDDVITTGATVAAAAKVLRKAGAARVSVLALALVTDASG